MENVETGIRGPGLRCMSPDYDSKEIKNIYVDCKFISFPVTFFILLVLFQFGASIDIFGISFSLSL